MKKSISILLLSIILYNFLGYYVVYLSLLTSAKNDMKARISEYVNDNTISSISFPFVNNKVQDNDFAYNDDNEFTYKENLYDIVKAEVTGGTITFYCINDKNEEQVNKALINHIQKNLNEGSQKKSASMIKNIIKNGVQHKDLFISKISSINSKKYFHSPINYTPRVVYDITSPPPKDI